MKRLLLGCLFVPLVLNSAGVVLGDINSNTGYTLDLTNMKEAPKKAKWSEQNRITVHPDGLGWGTRDDQGSRDVWVETEPISIGLSWRPTSIATVKVTVERPGISGMLYVRYTADGKHWTTWQYLEQAAQVAGNGLTETFQGMVRVPYRERGTYEKLRMEYARRQDVPWSSDEEALVRDIVKGEPNFFEKSTPFIGHVQFLYEAQLHGGQRIEGLKCEINWQLGGKHQPPKDENTRRGREIPWRFKAP